MIRFISLIAPAALVLAGVDLLRGDEEPFKAAWFYVFGAGSWALLIEPLWRNR